MVNRSQGKPKDWSEHPFDSKPDFQEEFSYVVSNEEVSEVDCDFSTDVYDNTYLRELSQKVGNQIHSLLTSPNAYVMLMVFP